MHTRGKPLAGDADLDLVARQTSGLTGADLANICNEAAIFAGRATATRSRPTDFQAALERVVAGMQSRRVITDHEKRVVAYHEAGHALCSELLPSVEKVHRISIVPRGQALGYTLNLPEEDRYLKTKDELMDYLVVLLGGRVTEHLVFGQITTGASDDLRKVHEISRSMVTEYGMGSKTSPSSCPPPTTRWPTPPAGWSTRSSSSSPTRPTAARWPWSPSTARCSRRWPARLLDHEVLERADIDAPGGRARGRAAAPGAAGAAQRRRRAGRPRPSRTSAGRVESRAVFGEIDHIGVAVEDLDEAVALYQDALGMAHQHRERVEEFGVEAVLLEIGDAHIELLTPIQPDSGVAQVPRAQRARGCTTWPTAPTTSTPRWSACAPPGMRLIDEQPRTGIRDSRVAFLHPKSTGGVLTEIVQPAPDH